MLVCARLVMGVGLRKRCERSGGHAALWHVWGATRNQFPPACVARDGAGRVTALRGGLAVRALFAAECDREYRGVPEEVRGCDAIPAA